MIVTKAVKMAEMMNVPVLGIVENMSYFVCPDCGKKHFLFGTSHMERWKKPQKDFSKRGAALCKLTKTEEYAHLVDGIRNVNGD